MESKVSIIAAIGKNRELGRGNDLLWRSTEDMAHFKGITMNHPVIMGRKTYESIPPKFRPLPGRENIVVTRNANWEPDENITIFTSLEEAINYSKEKDNEVFIIGGAQIYGAALPYTDRLYMTFVEDTVADADVFFPEFKEFNKEISREDITTENGLKLSWVTLEK